MWFETFWFATRLARSVEMPGCFDETPDSAPPTRPCLAREDHLARNGGTP